MKTFFINSRLENYLLSLEKPTVSKILRFIELLEIFGKKLGMPYTKQITTNLYELRVRGQQEVRILYCFHHNQIVFVHAFIKKTQKTPQREIDTALSRINLLK